MELRQPPEPPESGPPLDPTAAPRSASSPSGSALPTQRTGASRPRVPGGDAVPPEQLVYARLLRAGATAAAALMVLTFTLYYLEWLEPSVPLTRLHQLWSLPVGDFLRESGVAPGWGWVAALPRSDVLNLAVLAALAGLSLPCLLALVPVYAARGDRVYVALIVAEVLIMALAASGVLGGVH